MGSNPEKKVYSAHVLSDYLGELSEKLLQTSKDLKEVDDIKGRKIVILNNIIEDSNDIAYIIRNIVLDVDKIKGKE